jgi:D-alanyl-D-alanine carboxypeptidase
MLASKAQTKLLAAMDDCIAAGAPGVILAVESANRSVSFLDACGAFTMGGARRLQPNDLFRAASVTKAVTAATVVRMASEEHWCLDDPVTRYLPANALSLLKELDGLTNPDLLTFRRLLSHTSGLPDYFFDPKFQERVNAEPGRVWHPEDLLAAAVIGGRLAFQPGTGFSYCDTGFVLAGLAVEKELGCSLDNAYRSLIFNPLAMEATHLEWPRARPGAEISHHYDGGRDLTGMNPTVDWAGGGLLTTAGDLARFMHGLFGCKLFDGRWLEDMTAWRDDLHWRQDSSARYLRYGLGIGVQSVCGEEIVGATGVWGGFAWYWPKGDTVITGTVNQRRIDRGALFTTIVCALKELG